MKRNLSLYFRLISIQLRSQMQFPVSFWVDVFTTALLNGSYFVSTYLVLQRFGNLAGWTIGELAFLYGMVELSFGLMDMVFSGFDPDDFATNVRQGSLDQVLLRPVNVLTQIFGSRFLLRRLGRISQGLAVLLLSFSLVDINWTLGRALYLPVVVVCMMAAFGSLFIAGSTITFWTVERVEAVNIVTYGGTEVMSYPAQIYPRWLRGFFTYFIPFAFLNYYPALYFLGKPDPFGLPGFAPFLAPLAAGLMLFAALRFFNFGLKHYQSTGT